MAYTRTWDNTRPNGATTNASTIDSEIQYTRVDLEERVSALFGMSASDFAADPVVPRKIALTHGTLTDDAQTISATVTWNDAADTFTAIKLNVTNTASAAGSKLIDLQVGGVSMFNVGRTGNVNIVTLSPAQGTITADAAMIDAVVTWNNGAVTFNAWKLNVTNTASAAASKLIDLQVGGVTQFNVTRAGVGTLTGALAIGGALTGATTGTFSGAVSATTLTASTAFVGPGTVSTTGVVRLANLGAVKARNAANSADIELISLDPSDVIQIGGSASGIDTNFGGDITQAAGGFIAAGSGGIKTGRVSALVIATGSMNDGAAAQVGTLTNAPCAGNPSKWIPIDDNGTTRYLPAWT